MEAPLEDPVSLAVWVKRHRAALGLTQTQLAQMVGYSTSTLRKIEQGAKLGVSLAMASRLADALDLSPAERAAFLAVASGKRPEDWLPASPAPSRLHRRAYLPVPVTSFVGRSEELRELAALLQRGDVR